MNNLWNLTAEGGRTINSTPLKGTIKQAEAYRNLMYDEKVVSVTPAEIFTLDHLEFKKNENGSFMCIDQGNPVFSGFIMANDVRQPSELESVSIHFVDEEFSSVICDLENFFLFPSFKKNIRAENS